MGTRRITHTTMGGCRILVRGQISDCNSLSGLNPLNNLVLNKKNNNLIYILT
jgi:hypothetical protein